MKIGEIVVRESTTLVKPLLEEIISGKYIAIDSLYESFADQSVVNSLNIEHTKT